MSKKSEIVLAGQARVHLQSGSKIMNRKTVKAEMLETKQLGVLILLLWKGLDDTKKAVGFMSSIQKSFFIMLEKCAL